MYTKGVRRFVWGTEGKRPLGRPRRRWKYITEMDIWEIGFRNVD
jgi:hypothetical protein